MHSRWIDRFDTMPRPDQKHEVAGRSSTITCGTRYRVTIKLESDRL